MYAFSDIIYYTSLLICIALGSYYKKIKDVEMKRSYGTGLGILITCLVCGHLTMHSIMMVWGNIIIIKCCNKEYIHHLSLAYTWLYLAYLTYNLETTYYVLWVHQAIALRLVGLAFEISSAEKITLRMHAAKISVQKQLNQDSKASSNTLKNQDSKDSNRSVGTQDSKHVNPEDKSPSPSTTYKFAQTGNTSSNKNSASKFYFGELSNVLKDPTAVDIIAYAYYFIGLHKGPYYRWKTFNEHFRAPFGILGDCRVITEQKLKKALACAAIFMLLRMKFPVQVYYEKEFYASYGTDFRYLYNIPQMLIYVLQYQTVLLLTTAVCTEAGFGVYPTRTQPLPGHGPSARFSLLNLAIGKQDIALTQEYNFAMLKCFENEKLLIGPRMRDTLRGWDMSTRYWFWAHTYKGLTKTNKEMRSGLSFLAWTFWCGPTIPQLIISSTLWVHLHLENEYSELYNTNVGMKMPWDIGFSIMRLFCLTYLTPCLILRDSSVVLQYYNSIFWVYHIVLLVLIIGAVGLSKDRFRQTTEMN